MLVIRAMSVRSLGMAPSRLAFAPRQSAISTVPTVSPVPIAIVQMALRATRTGTMVPGQEIATLQGVQWKTPQGKGRNASAKMGSRAVLRGGDQMPMAVVNRHLVTASVTAMAARAQTVGVRMASQVRFHGKGQLHWGTAHLPHARSRIPTDSQVSAASVRMALLETSNGRVTRPTGNANLLHVQFQIQHTIPGRNANAKMASRVTSRGLALMHRAIANQRHAMWKILPRRQDFSANAIRLHFVLM